jgi:hypothetical protein
MFAPGGLHHVMVREIERRAIVFDESIRLEFLRKFLKQGI